MDNLTTINMSIAEDNKNITSLPKPKEDEYNDCEICGMELDSSVTLLCKHKFHYECILDWYKECVGKIATGSQSQYVSRSCPYCRSDGGYLSLPEKDSKYIKGIHKPSHKPRDKKVKTKKATPPPTSSHPQTVIGQCLGIAKSTKKQCKKKGIHNGYCGWHKDQAPSSE